MKILIAPDKFKGSLSAYEVCQAIDNGLKGSGKSLETIYHPMADGGDGALEILSKHLDLRPEKLSVHDPLGRPIVAEYFTSENIAFIEMASASGLVLLKEEERNPLQTSTFGTGQMVLDALNKGYRQFFLFLGGSATNDAGMGISAALGFQFLDDQKQQLEPIGANLLRIRYIEQSSSMDLSNLDMTLLCDVSNPLFGPNGAAYVYAKQKGASPKQIEILDQGLRNFHQIIFQQFNRDVSELPGSGAAGGIGAGLVALFGAQLRSGFDTISALTNLETQIQSADWVISGEGRLDGQSLQGKVIDGLDSLCKKHNKPLSLFVGKNELDEKDRSKIKTQGIYSVMEIAKDLSDAMVNGEKYLKELASQFRNQVLD